MGVRFGVADGDSLADAGDSAEVVDVIVHSMAGQQRAADPRLQQVLEDNTAQLSAGVGEQ